LFAIVARSLDGLALSDLEDELGDRISRRALQRRLASLVDSIFFTDVAADAGRFIPSRTIL